MAVDVEQPVQPPAPREKLLRSAGRMERLFAPIDISPLVFFRLSFGFLLLLDLCRYTFGGNFQRNWVDPEIHFTYFGFSWVRPLPGAWFYLHTAALFLGAAGITLGAFYRVSSAVFAVAFAWMFLIEQSTYLNHFYLITLLAFVAVFLPANRAFSIDAWRRPAIRASVVPGWTILILRAQLAIVYVFAAIAKINHDWLRGEPVRTWFTGRAANGALPPFMAEESVIYFISYGGLLFDLLIVPLLLWKRTRILAVALLIFFHISNAFIFSIGIFPFLSIALTLLFLPPQWHARFLDMQSKESRADASVWWRPSPIVPICVGIFLAIQILLPFRHWLYPGNVHWTEEGHRYAWHMMLRSKSGSAYYIVEDHRTNELWRINPEEHLNLRQYRKMNHHPEMLLQFAHHIRDRWPHRQISIYAVASVSLNGRPPTLLIDPEIDLASIQYGWRPARWILPLENQYQVPARYQQARIGQLLQ